MLPGAILSKTGYKGCLASLSLNGEPVNPLKDPVLRNPMLISGCLGGPLTPLGDKKKEKTRFTYDVLYFDRWSRTVPPWHMQAWRSVHPRMEFLHLWLWPDFVHRAYLHQWYIMSPFPCPSVLQISTRSFSLIQRGVSRIVCRWNHIYIVRLYTYKYLFLKWHLRVVKFSH